MNRKSVLILLIAIIAIGAMTVWNKESPRSAKVATSPEPSFQVSNHETPENESHIEYPVSNWKAGGIEVAEISKANVKVSQTLTGKVTLNEDRLAHIFPLVEGRAEEIKIQFGQQVKHGDPLVIVQSKQVGQGMLELYQNRLKLEFAVTQNNWTQEISKNTIALVDLMRANSSVEQIEAAFQNRVLGDYRERLMTPYVALIKAENNANRLAPLSQDGAISGRQLVEAESERDANRAIMKSILEQISQDTVQVVKLSDQNLSERKTTVAVSEANLKILGFDDSDLKDINPAEKGETLAHYKISAPFDGTIISKDVAFLERVSPEHQILTIADLSTVWITADIYQSQISVLNQLAHKKIQVSSDSLPTGSVEAEIFYTGDVFQEDTRTMSLRAIADNPHGYLKPGMFVSIELPDPNTVEVMQVPVTALMSHEDKTFVFAYLGEGIFEPREVSLGKRNLHSVEIVNGLNTGEQIAVTGVFALKSKMLASLLEE